MLAAASLVLALAGPAVEPSVPTDPVVGWDAPAGCPSSTDVTRAVERYVGRALGNEAVHAEATIDRDAEAGFRLRLVVSTQQEADVRVLRDSSCSVLADAAALLVAMAVDPDATAKVVAAEPQVALRTSSVTEANEARADLVPAASPGEVPQTEAAEASEPVDDTETAPDDPGTEVVLGRESDRDSRRCRPGWRQESSRRLAPTCGALGVSLPLQLGPLPRFGPGLSGHAAMLWPRVRLEVGGSYYFQQRTRVDATRGGDFRLSVGHLRGCGRLGVRKFEFPLCTGVELGALRGKGVGLGTSREDRVLWAGLLLDGGLAWSPVRWIALRALAGIVVPVAKYRFRISGVDDVHVAAPVGLRVGIGAEARFP
ncbi:MAG: hypothetical protein JKY37_08615 [Nannocystaceae bacterium]|nr:hypothetical protein [Nannocystaceae bacterium]